MSGLRLKLIAFLSMLIGAFLVLTFNDAMAENYADAYAYKIESNPPSCNSYNFTRNMTVGVSATLDAWGAWDQPQIIRVTEKEPVGAYGCVPTYLYNVWSCKDGVWSDNVYSTTSYTSSLGNNTGSPLHSSQVKPDFGEGGCEPPPEECPEKGTDAGTLRASINQEMPMCLDGCEVTGTIDSKYPPTIKLNEGHYNDELIFRGEYTGADCDKAEDYPRKEDCDSSGAIDQCYAGCGGEENVDFVGCNNDIFICDCLDIPKADVWLNLGDFLPDDVKDQYPDVFPPEKPTDSDGDGDPDITDPDDDNDNIKDENDSTPTGTRDPNKDTDGDGIRDSNDGDIDGDGEPNINDPTPYGSELDKDTDGDGISDKNDGDIDGDGELNINDPTPYGSSDDKTAENTNMANKQLDGISDNTKITANKTTSISNNTSSMVGLLGQIRNGINALGAGEGEGEGEGEWGGGSGSMGGIDTSGVAGALLGEKQRLGANIGILKESVSDLFSLNLASASGLPVISANTSLGSINIDFNNYRTFFAYLTWLVPLLCSISALFIIFD